MTIEFSLTKRQLETRSAIHSLAESIIRPQSLSWDRNHGIPNEFLQRIAMLAGSLGSLSNHAEILREPDAPADPAKKKERSVHLTTIVAAEELAWGDPALLLLPTRAPGLADRRFARPALPSRRSASSGSSRTSRRSSAGAPTRSPSRAREATWPASAPPARRCGASGC